MSKINEEMKTLREWQYIADISLLDTAGFDEVYNKLIQQNDEYTAGEHMMGEIGNVGSIYCTRKGFEKGARRCRTYSIRKLYNLDSDYGYEGFFSELDKDAPILPNSCEKIVLSVLKTKVLDIRKDGQSLEKKDISKLLLLLNKYLEYRTNTIQLNGIQTENNINLDMVKGYDKYPESSSIYDTIYNAYQQGYTVEQLEVQLLDKFKRSIEETIEQDEQDIDVSKLPTSADVHTLLLLRSHSARVEDYEKGILLEECSLSMERSDEEMKLHESTEETRISMEETVKAALESRYDEITKADREQLMYKDEKKLGDE